MYLVFLSLLDCAAPSFWKVCWCAFFVSSSLAFMCATPPRLTCLRVGVELAAVAVCIFCRGRRRKSSSGSSTEWRPQLKRREGERKRTSLFSKHAVYFQSNSSRYLYQGWKFTIITTSTLSNFLLCHYIEERNATSKIKQEINGSWT